MYKIIKRFFDFSLSLVGIILLVPIFLIIMLCIKLDSKGPVFFIQRRVGKNKTYFNIYKFRTMKTDAPKNMATHLLKHPEQYITRVGKILRRMSLDELPQVFNIFMGSMSIVGPRPALWNQYDLIEERDKYHANDIKPGLTGWAQINGRDTISIEDKAAYDGYYYDNFGFKLDMKCFIGTFSCVLKGMGIIEGVSENDQVQEKLIEIPSGGSDLTSEKDIDNRG